MGRSTKGVQMMTTLQRLLVVVAVLVLVLIILGFSFSVQCSETDGGDATPMPNSTIQFTVEDFYG